MGSSCICCSINLLPLTKYVICILHRYLHGSKMSCHMHVASGVEPLLYSGTFRLYPVFPISNSTAVITVVAKSFFKRILKRRWLQEVARCCSLKVLKNVADIDIVSFAVVLYGSREMDLMTSGLNCDWNLRCVATTVLVCWDCHDTTTRLGGFNGKHLFLTVLEAGKSKIKVLADSVCGEGPLPGS